MHLDVFERDFDRKIVTTTHQRRIVNRIIYFYDGRARVSRNNIMLSHSCFISYALRPRCIYYNVLQLDFGLVPVTFDEHINVVGILSPSGGATLKRIYNVIFVPMAGEPDALRVLFPPPPETRAFEPLTRVFDEPPPPPPPATTREIRRDAVFYTRLNEYTRSPNVPTLQ